jgi:hypothetical protein
MRQAVLFVVPRGEPACVHLAGAGRRGEWGRSGHAAVPAALWALDYSEHQLVRPRPRNVAERLFREVDFSPGSLRGLSKKSGLPGRYASVPSTPALAATRLGPSSQAPGCRYITSNLCATLNRWNDGRVTGGSREAVWAATIRGDALPA